jgi:hypothetical protein
VLLRLVPPRIHAYLDDGVVLLYLMGSFIVGLRERAMAIALMGAVIHFFLTRFTNYPAGTVRLLSFKAHGVIELLEGVLVLSATWLLLPGHAPGKHLAFLTFMGVLQLAAFAFSDYRWPLAAVGGNNPPPESGDASEVPSERRSNRADG